MTELYTPTPDAIDATGNPQSRNSRQLNGVRLGFLIHDVSRLRRHTFDRLMKPKGITRAQWWVLAHLSRHDGMMQTQLADILDVGKASLGTVIERLEKNGWIERKSDTNDRRAKRVYLAPPARKLVDEMDTLEFDFNQDLLADLSDQELEKLVAALQSIRGRLSGD